MFPSSAMTVMCCCTSVRWSLSGVCVYRSVERMAAWWGPGYGTRLQGPGQVRSVFAQVSEHRAVGETQRETPAWRFHSHLSLSLALSTPTPPSTPLPFSPPFFSPPHSPPPHPFPSSPPAPPASAANTVRRQEDICPPLGNGAVTNVVRLRLAQLCHLCLSLSPSSSLPLILQSFPLSAACCSRTVELL